MIAIRLALGASLVVALGGCGVSPGTTAASAATSPSPATSLVPVISPSPVATPADAWQQANIQLPSAVMTAPSLEPGYFCDPCHALAEDQLFGVGESPAGFIAVGVQQPPAEAIAFESSDGRDWAPARGFEGATGTTAIAAARNGRLTVIVGSRQSGATAWASTGGSGQWTEAPPQADLLVPYAAGAMTAVAPLGDGFVAGGYRDDPLHDAASAAVWRSTDGLTWHADDADGVFQGGRIWGIATSPGVVVAVGTGGDPNYGPAAAWRWTPATGWQTARIEPDAGGAMQAVAATPSGFVAVGLDDHDQGARSWTSPDGLTWTAAPDQPAFHYSQQPVRMQAVAAGPGGLIAGGWRSDAGKGSGVTWTSADGVTWQGPAWQNSFSGGQIRGVAVSGQAAVAVGRTGYPDLNQAAVWVRPIP